jgi:hypothetical protein
MSLPVQMDSQTEYCCLACGVPMDTHGCEGKTWGHVHSFSQTLSVGGLLILDEEAGGPVAELPRIRGASPLVLGWVGRLGGDLQSSIDNQQPECRFTARTDTGQSRTRFSM